MLLKYWRTMLCALALGLVGLVVWADDRIRGAALNKPQARAQMELPAAAPPAPELAAQSLPATPKTDDPVLNERNFDLSRPVVTTPVAPPVVPPPPGSVIDITVAPPVVLPPVGSAPDLDTSIKNTGAIQIIPAPAAPAQPEPPPPIPKAARPELKADPLLAGTPPTTGSFDPPAPPVAPGTPAQLTPPPPLAANSDLPPLPPAPPSFAPPTPLDSLQNPIAVPKSTLAPPPPMAAASLTTAAPFKLFLRMGGTQTPRFEIRDGDHVMLKVYCDKVELHGAQDGSANLPGLTASGKVRLHGAGLDGTCDSLTVISAKGEVTLKGHVHMTCYRGTNSSQVSAESMSFQLNRAGETPVNTKARGTSSVVPASTQEPVFSFGPGFSK